MQPMPPADPTWVEVMHAEGNVIERLGELPRFRVRCLDERCGVFTGESLTRHEAIDEAVGHVCEHLANPVN